MTIMTFVVRKGDQDTWYKRERKELVKGSNGVFTGAKKSI